MSLYSRYSYKGVQLVLIRITEEQIIVDADAPTVAGRSPNYVIFFTHCQGHKVTDFEHSL